MSLLTQRPSATPGTPPPPGPRGRPHPFTLGAVVMAIGASAFVHVNRSALPSPWATVALAAWIVAITLFCWATFVRARHLPLTNPPHPRAGVVYVASTLAMVGVMAAGRWALDEIGRPELQPAVVVVAVGLHFLPFAGAFRAPVFAVMGWVVAGIGVVGLLAGLVAGAEAVAAAAVVTGLVMLVVISIQALRHAKAAS